MGTEDMRRQQPNVERMGLLGATVEPVEAGARTLKEAVSAAIRDWVTNVDTTHYVIGSAVGPAPYPALVRDLQRVIGDEARAQALERAGAPARRAWSPAWAGAATRSGPSPPSSPTGMSSWSASRPAGEGLDARHGASLGAGRDGVLHGALSSVLQDEDGQILEAHSVSAGLDYPGVGPEHAFLRDSGRVRYESVTDAEAVAAFHELSRLEGIIPALEPAMRSPGSRQPAPAGRGHARHAQRPRRQGPRRGARAAMAERRAGDRARAASRPRSGHTGGGAALMPYLMGGFPIPRGVAGDGAGLRRVRRPGGTWRAFLRPARRRACDPGRRASGRSRRARRSSVCWTRSPRRSPPTLPVVVMCYANPILARGFERVAQALAERAVAGLIVPDMPAVEAGELRAACDARRRRTRAAGGADHPPEDVRRIAELARGFVYVVSVTGVTGERAALPPALGKVVERVRAAAEVPVAVGFGVGTPEQAAQVGEIADGVIIGSRLVRGIAAAATPQAGLEDVRAFLSDTVRALDPAG